MQSSVQVTDDQIDQLHQMFPNLERDVVASVIAAQAGDMDASLNVLLSMSN